MSMLWLLCYVKLLNDLLESVYATYRDGCEKSLWNISHDDTNEEDDGIRSTRSKHNNNNEEDGSHDEGWRNDEIDEVGHVPGQRRLTRIKTWCQVGDSTHHCPITRTNNNPTGKT